MFNEIKSDFLMKNIFTLAILLISLQNIVSQSIIKGTVKDTQTGETLIGCNVILQGTTIGAVTDLDGNYTISNVQAGSYNLVASYISYNQKINRVDVPKNSTVELNFDLEPATVSINEVKVTARKRQNTEMSMISTLKSQDLIVSGISNQQIQKSQDKDAAEVLRRIPGITITDGRFVIVRGLIERYNTVLLNGACAPSSEADVRAFSFDVMPSNMIDNILIYKTPAPELPSDFAGAAINVVTKNTVDENSVSFSYSAGYVSGTTMKDFYTYKGGKLDWLGIDDGTRALPSIFPSHNMMNDSLFKYDYKKPIQDSITKISKAFRNDVFQPYTKTALPNQSASLSINRRFVLGKVSLANMTALTYSNNFSSYDAERAEYQDPNPIIGKKSYNYNYVDNRNIQSIRAGIMHNWLVTFDDNNKIEFRNFLNQNSQDRTIIRTGVNYYTGSDPDSIMSYAMEFSQRTTYSGQLAGTSAFNNKNTEIDWIVGYSYANKLQPDLKRLFFLKQQNDEAIYQYRMNVASGSPLPERGGRFYSEAYENIRNLAVNLKQNIILLNRQFVLKTGVFYEEKNREFDARNIGIVYKNTLPVDMFLAVDSILNNSNFYYPGGFAYNENSISSNHYNAKSIIIAPYFGLKIPITKKLILYTGLRAEQYSRELTKFQKDVKNDPNIAFDTLDLFFSSNLSYSINEQHLIRFSYGKTANRPEFREIAPFYYKDFDLNAGVWGNDSIKNCYIDNFDVRYEWYPSPGEMISLAVFYKKFKDPIEILLIETGNQPDYKPFNTGYAKSQGIELDIRKSFEMLGDKDNFLCYFKNFTLVFNSSLIQSVVNTDLPNAREKEREMMGQSPYIINAGLYFNSVKYNLMMSAIYNRIGRRIVAVGTINNPHTWEMARNSLDFTLTKGLYKGLELRIGIKDIFNEPVHRLQYEEVTISGTNQKVDIEQTTLKYRPRTQYTIGLNFKF
jgi:hypothetical protein